MRLSLLREGALFSCFFVLKNLMIMLYPFVPQTMDKVRQSLNLPESVFSIDELGAGIPVGHSIGEKQQYFPMVEGSIDSDLYLVLEGSSWLPFYTGPKI